MLGFPRSLLSLEGEQGFCSYIQRTVQLFFLKDKYSHVLCPVTNPQNSMEFKNLNYAFMMGAVHMFLKIVGLHHPQ